MGLLRFTKGMAANLLRHVAHQGWLSERRWLEGMAMQIVNPR